MKHRLFCLLGSLQRGQGYVRQEQVDLHLVTQEAQIAGVALTLADHSVLQVAAEEPLQAKALNNYTFQKIIFSL